MGSTSSTQTITLTNTGTATLNISGITLGDTKDYLLNGNCGNSLPRGASCSLTVTFSPKSIAALNTAIIVASTAPSSPDTVPITGTGIPAPAPALSISPSALSFGSVAVGSTSPAQTITLTNTGTAPLIIATISWGDTTNYTISGSCVGTLQANDFCRLTVTFIPTKLATLNTAISVISNAPTSPSNIPVTGIGVPAPAPALSISPSSLSFGSIAVGSTSPAQIITLANTGTAPLANLGITLGDLRDYLLASTCGSSVPMNSSCSLTVTFSPKTIATLNTQITVVSNAPSSPDIVTITGAGIPAPAPLASLTPVALDFGRQPYNVQGSAQTLTLANKGTADLSNIAVSFSGLDPTDFAYTSTCATVYPNSSCTISVTFKPTLVASRAATIVVTDNDKVTPQTATLAGGGIVNLQPGQIFWGVDGHRDKGGPYQSIPLWDQVKPNQVADIKAVFGLTPNTIFYRAWDDIVGCGIYCATDIVTLQQNGVVPLLPVITYPNPAGDTGPGTLCGMNDQNGHWTYFQTNPPKGMTPQQYAYSWAYNQTLATVQSEPTNIYWVIGNEWVNQGPISCQYLGDGSLASDWSGTASFPIYLGAMAGALQAIREKQPYAVVVGGASSGSTLTGLALALNMGLEQQYPGLAWNFTAMHWYQDAAIDLKDNAGVLGINPGDFGVGKNVYALFNIPGKALFIDEFGSGDGGVVGPNDVTAASDLISLMTNFQAHANSSSNEGGVVAANVYSLYQDFTSGPTYTSHFLYLYTEPNTQSGGLAPEGVAVAKWIVLHGNPSTH